MKKCLLFLFLGLLSLNLLAQNTVMKQYNIKTLYLPATTTWAANVAGTRDSVIIPVQAGATWSVQILPKRSSTDSVYVGIKAYISNSDSTVNVWSPLKGFNDGTATWASTVTGDTLVNANAALGNNAWTYNSATSSFQNLRLKFLFYQIAATHKSTMIKSYFVAKIPVAAIGGH